MTLDEVMHRLVTAFNPAKAKGVNAVVQLNASGEGGGNYQIKVADAKCELIQGVAANPALTIDVATQDWIDIVTGKLDPTRAFMSGKLRIKGDLGLMMRFQSMFGQ